MAYVDKSVHKSWGKPFYKHLHPELSVEILESRGWLKRPWYWVVNSTLIQDTKSKLQETTPSTHNYGCPLSTPHCSTIWFFSNTTIGFFFCNLTFTLQTASNSVYAAVNTYICILGYHIKEETKNCLLASYSSSTQQRLNLHHHQQEGKNMSKVKICWVLTSHFCKLRGGHPVNISTFSATFSIGLAPPYSCIHTFFFFLRRHQSAQIRTKSETSTSIMHLQFSCWCSTIEELHINLTYDVVHWIPKTWLKEHRPWNFCGLHTWL